MYVIYKQVYFNSSVIKLFQITTTSVICFVFQFSSKAFFFYIIRIRYVMDIGEGNTKQLILKKVNM